MRAPMETCLQKFVEPARLAARGATLQGVLPNTAITRLGEHYRCAGPTEVSLHFHLGERGRIRVDGELATELVAECQRCLEPVNIVIAQRISVELVDVEAFPSNQQTALDEFDDAVEYRVKLNLHELVEDELLLACPIVPQHAVGECSNPEYQHMQKHATSVDGEAQDKVPGDTRKPFAGLAQLIGRNKNDDTD